MLGAGTVINPILKIVTTIVVLGAVYLFIVKPILDTTNNAFDQFGTVFDGLPTSIQDDVQDAYDSLDDSDARDRLQRCIKDARSNTQRINRCVERFAS